MSTQRFDQHGASLTAVRVLGMPALALAVLVAALLIARPTVAQAAEPALDAMPAVWGETLAGLETQDLVEGRVIEAGFKFKKRFGGHRFRGHRGFRGGFFKPHGFARHGGFRRGFFFSPGFKFKGHGFKGHGFKGHGGFKKKGVFFFG